MQKILTWNKNSRIDLFDFFQKIIDSNNKIISTIVTESRPFYHSPEIYPTKVLVIVEPN